MMIRKLRCPGICFIFLSILSLPISAGQLYRFADENGVLTLSRSLPPESAQKGYDILNDKTMRLIERVAPALSAEQIAEMEAQKAQDDERQKQADIEAKQAEKQRENQARIDRVLLTTYPSEQSLIKARDKDIGYRQEQIETYQSKLPQLQDNLLEVQKQAADRELNGEKITPNMQKRLNAAHEEIIVRKQAIEQYQAEIDTLSAQYQADLERLRYLLNKRASQ